MSSRNLVMLALLFTFLIVLTVPAWAQNQDTQGTGQSVYGCTIIDKPGSYALAKNITARQSDLKHIRNESACILIIADFVTLDLRGYSITGPGTGIYAFGVYSTANASLKWPLGTLIRNGSVSNFDRGMAVEGDSHTVEGVRSVGNNVGITFDGDSHRIKDAVVRGNWMGILAGFGSGSTVEHCQVHENFGSGIALKVYWDPENNYGSVGSRIVGNTVSGNGEYGIYAVCPSLILQNMAYDNQGGNIFVKGQDCVSSDNNPPTPEQVP